MTLLRIIHANISLFIDESIKQQYVTTHRQAYRPKGSILLRGLIFYVDERSYLTFVNKLRRALTVHGLNRHSRWMAARGRHNYFPMTSISPQVQKLPSSTFRRREITYYWELAVGIECHGDARFWQSDTMPHGKDWLPSIPTIPSSIANGLCQSFHLPLCRMLSLVWCKETGIDSIS